MNSALSHNVFDFGCVILKSRVRKITAGREAAGQHTTLPEPLQPRQMIDHVLSLHPAAATRLLNY